MSYQKIAEDDQARAGVLQTARGEVPTPFFMSVATRAAIKAGVSAEELAETKAPVMLCNTYHLHVRPGEDLVKKAGGLHDFTNWKGPILTDSGGYQVFSLNKKKITDDGVTFWSHVDGKKLYIDAEKSIQIQHDLGADIIMAFDECPPSTATPKIIQRACDRTYEWAKRSLAEHKALKAKSGKDIKLFGIVQGGNDEALRNYSLGQIASLDFDGFALGGLAVGEPPHVMHKTVMAFTPKLPEDKAKYLMGVGTPTDLLMAIKAGIDMFDCVLPMRNARHGVAYTWAGALRISNEKHKEDFSPLDERVKSAASPYTRAYLRHLYTVGEDLAKKLLTIHNLAFYHSLMATSRQKIIDGEFNAWADKLVERWKK